MRSLVISCTSAMQPSKSVSRLNTSAPLASGCTSCAGDTLWLGSSTPAVTAAAIGYAARSGITYGEALIKNRYIGRTFIDPEDRVRKLGIPTVVDRLMPVLHNLKNNGQSWRENRVPPEEVLAVNAVIGEVLPSVWEHIQVRLGELSAKGLFEYY